MQKELVYVMAAGTIFYVSTSVLRAKTGHIFAILTCLLLFLVMSPSGALNVRHPYEEDELDEQNLETERRYKLLGAPTHFHFDTNLINFFYGLLSWRTLNPDAFDTSVEACNNVLALEEQAEKGLERCVDNYEIAADQARLALDHLHTFVYSISQPVLTSRLSLALSRLSNIMALHLKLIRQSCSLYERDKDSVTVGTRYLQREDHPLPYDYARNQTPFGFEHDV